MNQSDGEEHMQDNLSESGESSDEKSMEEEVVYKPRRNERRKAVQVSTKKSKRQKHVKGNNVTPV